MRWVVEGRGWWIWGGESKVGCGRSSFQLGPEPRVGGFWERGGAACVLRRREESWAMICFGRGTLETSLMVKRL